MSWTKANEYAGGKKCTVCGVPVTRKNSRNLCRFHIPRKPMTDEQKEKIRVTKIGDKNPMWTGNNVGKFALRDFVKRRLQKSNTCSLCGEIKKLEITSTIEVPTRDLSTWIWICRKCNMEKDGRMKILNQSNKKYITEEEIQNQQLRWKQYYKEYRENNKEKVREQARNFYKKNVLKLREKNKEYRLKNKQKLKEKGSKFYFENRDRIIAKRRLREPELKIIRRKYILNKKFNITKEEYEKMNKKQNGLCYICNRENTRKGWDLSVDHCHTTGKVRGLLCSKCNLAIGLFEENIDSIKASIKYIKKFSKDIHKEEVVI